MKTGQGKKAGKTKKKVLFCAGSVQTWLLRVKIP
jgi:hypothetical protein